MAAKGRKVELAFFHRNVAVIDVSEDLVLLSPPLLLQNMSQNTLVTFTKERDGGKKYHAIKWNKFRLT